MKQVKISFHPPELAQSYIPEPNSHQLLITFTIYERRIVCRTSTIQSMRSSDMTDDMSYKLHTRLGACVAQISQRLLTNVVAESIVHPCFQVSSHTWEIFQQPADGYRFLPGSSWLNTGLPCVSEIFLRVAQKKKTIK